MLRYFDYLTSYMLFFIIVKMRNIVYVDTVDLTLFGKLKILQWLVSVSERTYSHDMLVLLGTTNLFYSRLYCHLIDIRV